MNNETSNSAHIAAVEALMLEKFKTEPFHNLHLLSGKQLHSPSQGGTCSDKTLSFLKSAQAAGFDASLHSGFIDGREIHRLAKIQIEGRMFFADVGNGWPALKLYPSDREVGYSCFGMSFRTAITPDRVTVFHTRNGRESRQLDIDIRSRPEAEIQAQIAGRFTSGIVYPFSTSIRFARIVGDRFLFLRGDRLEIYGDTEFQAIEGVKPAEVPAVLVRFFSYDVMSQMPDLMNHLGARE